MLLRRRFVCAVFLLVEITFAQKTEFPLTPQPESHKGRCLIQHSLATRAGIISDLRRLRKHSLEEVKKDAPLEQANDQTVKVQYPALGSPLVSCGQTKRSSASAKEEDNLYGALEIFCKAGLGRYAEFFVDPAYHENYKRWSDSEGWINDAFVTFMGTQESKANIAAEEDLLVRSVQHFSNKPVIVTNFNSRIPAAFNASNFPNMILMHGRSTSEVYPSFNYNKITSMMFTKVRHGMVLDGDQFVSHGVDTMFSKIAAETNETYPYPIMPVHWMSRDPESSDMTNMIDYSWRFPTGDAPKRTMRWGQAHPTWTHYALPWLAKWTSYILAPSKTRAPHWLSSIDHVEDEDMLNVAMWADNLTKQWCRYDITSPTDFDMYLQQLGGPGPYGADSKYYPRGIAIVFYTAHDAKIPSRSSDYLGRLWDDADGHHHRKAIFYNGQWFGSASKLKESDPTIPCIL